MSNVHRIVMYSIMKVKLFLNWKFAECSYSFRNICIYSSMESPPSLTPLRPRSWVEHYNYTPIICNGLFDSRFAALARKDGAGNTYICIM
jgi:hypothetical protein